MFLPAVYPTANMSLKQKLRNGSHRVAHVGSVKHMFLI